VRIAVPSAKISRRVGAASRRKRGKRGR